MKKRYLPFGYQITDGKTTIVQEEAEAVQYIFEEYTAGKSLRKIAENMTARKTPYHEDSSKWNQNMVSRVLANEIYCGNEKYPPEESANLLHGFAAVSPRCAMRMLRRTLILAA